MPERPKLDSQTLKRLLSYMRAYKGTLVLVTICILLSAVAGAASSMFLQKLIDGYIVPMLGTASPDFSGLIRALVTIGCVYLVGTLATWLYNRRMVTIARARSSASATRCLRRCSACPSAILTRIRTATS